MIMPGVRLFMAGIPRVLHLGKNARRKSKQQAEFAFLTFLWSCISDLAGWDEVFAVRTDPGI